MRVTVYLLDVHEELETWPECERRQRAWFTPSAAAEAVEEPELRQLLLRLDADPAGALSSGPAAKSSPGAARAETGLAI